jgi:hypothetical protein
MMFEELHDDIRWDARPDEGAAAVSAVSKGDDRRAAWAANVASAAAVLYGLPHLWWGLGVDFMFPGDMAKASESGNAVLGYWGLGFFSILAAAGPQALVRPWGRVFHRWLVIGAGWTVSVALVVWGLGLLYLKFFLAIGRVESAGQFVAQDSHPQSVWAWFWYPNFLVMGLALGAAIYYYQRRAGAGDRRPGRATVPH